MSEPAEIVNLAAFRQTRQQDLVDTEANRLWDLLEQATAEAWTWRDHESLDVLECIVNTLRTFVEIPGEKS